MTHTLARAFAAAILLALAVAAPASAQLPEPPSGERPPRELRAGLRLGAFEMINSPDSYDAVYGDPMVMLGGQLEWQVLPRWVLALTLDYGKVDGEWALPADPPIKTGIDETLTYVPLHLSLAWRVDRGGDWAVHLGAGPSLLLWEADAGISSADGSEVGGHLLVSLRQLRPRWSFGGELRWSAFPDAASEGGLSITELYGEDDLGGLSLHLVALRRF